MILFSRLLRVSFLCVLFGLSGCTSFYRQAADFAIKVERHRSDLERKEIDLPGGLHYAYLEGGQGEPLLLIHGFGGNKDNFTRVARYLTSHYHVIVPDLIGFAESTHLPDADYTAAAQVERLRALVHALGIENIHLGGNSMGGYIALSYAAHYPNEVASLWLIDSGGVQHAPKSEMAQTFEKTGNNPLLVRSEDDFARFYAQVMSDPPYIPRPLLDVLARERIENLNLEQHIFNQIIVDSVEKDIAGLATPTLIVWGDQDRVIHVGTAEILHRLLPRSQVLIMPQIGHAPMIERPQQSAEDYLRFREALPAS